MAEEHRRLAAIMAVDVVGSSRLMAEDEAAALDLLRRLRSEVLEPRIAAHGGRLFKAMGDGFLAEFSSSVQALRCALAIQDAMRSGALALQLRAAVHQGDVVEADGGSDLLGDGVNVAARLEGLAEPGAIVVSARVREDVEGKVAIAISDLGEQSLKNIPRPVRAFRVCPDGGAGSPKTTSRERPCAALPDKPSLVVLPFQNMSGDPEQEYFADGMVEEITTALSRIRWLFVIARNSAFTYKGKAVDVRQIGRELGVRYVVEGSVRKAGQRVRITAQLVEAETGRHIWADRFDGALAGVFELQDHVTEAVAGAVEPGVRFTETEISWRKRPESLTAYDQYLRGLSRYHVETREASDDAARLLRQAIATDASYAPAKATLAHCLMLRGAHRWTKPQDIAEAVLLAREALAAASNDAEVLRLAGHVISTLGMDVEAGLVATRRAVAMNPASAAANASAGWAHNQAGEGKSAVQHFERALRLSPRDPNLGRYLSGLSIGYFLNGHFAEAEREARAAAAEMPLWPLGHLALALALAKQGKIQEAQMAARRLLEVVPEFRITQNALFRGLAMRVPEQAAAMQDAAVASGIPL